MFRILKKYYFQFCGFSKKVTFIFLLQENTFKPRKTTISSTLLIDKHFKGTVVNRTLPSLYERSLEIMLTVSLSESILLKRKVETFDLKSVHSVSVQPKTQNTCLNHY